MVCKSAPLVLAVAAALVCCCPTGAQATRNSRLSRHAADLARQARDMTRLQEDLSGPGGLDGPLLYSGAKVGGAFAAWAKVAAKQDMGEEIQRRLDEAGRREQAKRVAAHKKISDEIAARVEGIRRPVPPAPPALPVLPSIQPRACAPPARPA